MTYIHELRGWPAFTWDAAALSRALAAVRHKQGRQIGHMEALGFEVRADAGLTALTEDVVRSSAIEGQVLDPEEVRAAILVQRGLEAGGLKPPTGAVEGIVRMLLDATGNHAARLPVARLFDWHTSLFQAGRSAVEHFTVGAWRTDTDGPMRVLSGPVGRERIHFEAPAALRLDAEMCAFLDWFNAPSSEDPVLRAGVAHLWFITVHPFDDGNGRIARALTDMLLARADGVEQRFYSMSSAIAAERSEYYRQLEVAQRGGLDITGWLTWFLDCLDRTLDQAGELLRAVLHKAAMWRRINTSPVNERQRTVLDRMLSGFEGHLTSSKYAKIAGCSPDTALRDMRELLRRHILVKNPGGGRSTSYRLGDVEGIVD